jgi:hypothetical protein
MQAYIYQVPNGPLTSGDCGPPGNNRTWDLTVPQGGTLPQANTRYQLALGARMQLDNPQGNGYPSTVECTHVAGRVCTFRAV